jgi:hypothetical protein
MCVCVWGGGSPSVSPGVLFPCMCIRGVVSIPWLAPVCVRVRARVTCLCVRTRVRVGAVPQEQLRLLGVKGLDYTVLCESVAGLRDGRMDPGGFLDVGFPDGHEVSGKSLPPTQHPHHVCTASSRAPWLLYLQRESWPRSGKGGGASCEAVDRAPEWGA